MARAPDVLKYFHEEPALLESLTPDHEPDARRRRERSGLPPAETILDGDPFDTRDAYRGYLAGTNRSDGHVGLTSLQRPEPAYASPIVDALGGRWWGQYQPDGALTTLAPDALRRVLRAPADTAVLVTAPAPVADDRIAAVTAPARARALSALQTLLEAVHVVLFPEPAHDGHDWSLWSQTPLRDRLVAAFRARPEATVRRFVIPYQKARSESKFYFETWQPTEAPLPDYVEEV